MKLWLSKSSDVPIHEQLMTQVILGIVSADLAPGEVLPSTGQVARLFHIHPNTVRAAYRDLMRRGWVEFRTGSGFYVRDQSPDHKMDPKLDLDRLISSFFNVARDRGYALTEIQTRIARWFLLQPPDHILLIEPEAELRDILVAEVGDKSSLRVLGASVEECANPKTLVGAFCVALLDSAKDIRAVLPPEVPCFFLHTRSISKSLSAELKPAPDTLITVVSRWSNFLHWAHTTLVAVGIDAGAIDLRDARRKGWDRGLASRSFVITDSLLARRLPGACHVRVFQIIADESLKELDTKLHQLTGLP